MTLGIYQNIVSKKGTVLIKALSVISHYKLSYFIVSSQWRIQGGAPGRHFPSRAQIFLDFMHFYLENMKEMYVRAP